MQIFDYNVKSLVSFLTKIYVKKLKKINQQLDVILPDFKREMLTKTPTKTATPPQN